MRFVNGRIVNAFNVLSRFHYSYFKNEHKKGRKNSTEVGLSTKTVVEDYFICSKAKLNLKIENISVWLVSENIQQNFNKNMYNATM